MLHTTPRVLDPLAASTADFSTEWSSWLAAGAGVAGAIAAAVLLQVVLFRILRALLADGGGDLYDRVLRHARRPALLVLCVLAVRTMLPTLDLTPGVADAVSQALGIAAIVTVAWLLVMLLHTIEWMVLRRHDLRVRDNLQARRVTTQVRILRRSLGMVVVIVAVAAILMTFPRVRQLGASLLASAGIVGLVVGLAARPAVENLIAGLQLAFTEPIRLEDVVIIEGEWGRIEEITSTYVVVRIWDERRLIVPFTKFIHEPFQNWTRTSTSLLGTVFLHLDYRVPVEALRQELRRIVEASTLWDRRVCGLQVTDVKQSTVEVRAVVSAADASQTFDLRCAVREQLLAFLQRHHPDSLPRLRAEVAGLAAAG